MNLILLKQYNMADDLQVNALKRTLGQLYMRLGTAQIRGAVSDFTDIEGTFAQFCKPLLGLPVSQLDDKYYFTSWDNWQKIIATINPVLQQFPWESERFDCDKRSFLVTSLTALWFDINTVRPMYCDVYLVSNGQYAYTHYANVIVTSDGQAYLWDVDNRGLTTKITAQNPIIGDFKYVLKAVK